MPRMLSSSEAKIETAAAFKAKGNAFFKAGENINALREYHSALTFLQGLNRAVMGVDSGDAESKQKMSEVDLEISLIYSNMAAVHLKNSKWIRAVQCCDEALKKNKDNKKASFRKATALNAQGEVIKAKNLLDELDKDDPSVKQLQRQIAMEDKARSAKSDKDFRGMFDKKAKVATPTPAA
ncbi:hypothetical protein BDY24DRAFT_164823 [Mrakia frigida]|uniref:uncharacterized protein n=1 Tax=Mrakia frigida TaxID=29902 RepID=UPI003FCBFAF2